MNYSYPNDNDNNKTFETNLLYRTWEWKMCAFLQTMLLFFFPRFSPFSLFSCVFCISSQLSTTYLVPHWTCSWQISLPILNTSSSSQGSPLSTFSGLPPGWVAVVHSQTWTYDIALKWGKFPLADTKKESRLNSVTGHNSFSHIRVKKAGTWCHTAYFSKICHLFQASHREHLKKADNHRITE